VGCDNRTCVQTRGFPACWATGPAVRDRPDDPCLIDFLLASRLDWRDMLRPFQGIVPKLSDGVFVEESAIIIGDVTIGQDSSVWFHSVVRGDVHYIRIGSRTNIQDLCVLHVTHD